MNQTRQDERLKWLHKKGALESSHLFAALNAPVFEWNPGPDPRKLTDEEFEFVKQNIETSNTNIPTVSPFPCFRISRKDCFDQWFHYPAERKWMLIRCAYETKDTGPEQIFVNIYSMDAGHRCEYRSWHKETEITSKLTVNGKIRPEVREAMLLCVNTLSYFLFELMLPGNAVLKVEPKPEKNKVSSWHLARTHYLIITRKQAKECQQHRRHPTDHEIVLAAHYRRAHFRKLMSEKFTYQRGKLIPVRQAWVGPKEWEGLDGKIYKLIEH